MCKPNCLTAFHSFLFSSITLCTSLYLFIYQYFFFFQKSVSFCTWKTGNHTKQFYYLSPTPPQQIFFFFSLSFYLFTIMTTHISFILSDFSQVDDGVFLWLQKSAMRCHIISSSSTLVITHLHKLIYIYLIMNILCREKKYYCTIWKIRIPNFFSTDVTRQSKILESYNMMIESQISKPIMLTPFGLLT